MEFIYQTYHWLYVGTEGVHQGGWRSGRAPCPRVEKLWCETERKKERKSEERHCLEWENSHMYSL